MKRFNCLLSLVLVPALTLQAGHGGRGGHGTTTPPTTCTNGAGATPTTPTLPTAVSGIQTINPPTAPTTYTFTVGNSASIVPAGNTVFKLGGIYGVWCTFPSAPVPGGGYGAQPIADPTVKYTPQNYQQYTTSTLGGSYGTAGVPLYDPNADSFTLPALTLTQEWNAVNWILNNPNGSTNENPTGTDTQYAIWQILHPGDNQWVSVTGLAGTKLTPASAALYLDALNHTDFIPGPGGVVAVLMVPCIPGDQGFIVPVPAPCAATGSVSFTKTASATSVAAFKTVTYTYTVKNTGTTSLGNIIITDDNGTPSYNEDDVQLTVPGTLAPGATYTVKNTVYLPISLFYQSGNSASYDTLIPQIPAAPSNALLLTYLIDSDVSDNTYGSGASAGWANVGGHTFTSELGNYAEFAFYDSRGNLVSDFKADYLSSGSSFPSAYGSAGLHGSMVYGNSKYVDYITSTLADNLNGYPKFYTDTVNSPVGDDNWQATSGYKVIVDKGIFGIFGMGSIGVKKNFMNAVGTAYSGKCSSPFSGSCTPTIVTSKVTNTAYLCATVCGCSTVVHAVATACVTVTGSTQPKCSSVAAHYCQAPKCGCTCDQCKAGNHSGCSHVGCTDPICHANKCNHNTVICKTNKAVYSW